MIKLFLISILLFSCGDSESSQEKRKGEAIPAPEVQAENNQEQEQIESSDSSAVNTDSNEDYESKISELQTKLEKKNRELEQKEKELKSVRDKKDEHKKSYDTLKEETAKLKEEIAGYENEERKAQAITDAAKETAKADNYKLYTTNYKTTNFLILIILLSIILVSALASLYLYKWRVSLSGSKNALFLAEDLDKMMRDWNEKISETSRIATQSKEAFNKGSKRNIQRLDEAIEIFNTMNATIKKKEKEIERYKKGYDTTITKKFLKRFIRINEIIEKVDSKQTKEELLKRLRLRFEDAFAECDLEPWSPNPGEEIKKYQGQDIERIDTIQAKNEIEEFTIAEVLSCGYRIANDDKHEIIVAAKVNVYGEFKKNNKEENIKDKKD
tara:strand:+ start:1682 stop:2836 length:1155 start_codon:yes stop_codon:yes gene_type:complete